MSIRRAILKATDAKLRSDNWQYILEVCDLISDDPEDGGEEAIEVIEQRLEQNDANVVLRTLSLIISLAENCGSRLKQSIDSKKFTKILLSLIEDRSIHSAVKRSIAKTVQQLTKSFQSDPSLRYMGDLLLQITKSYPLLLEDDEQPNVPSKREMTSESKQREEKELEEALKISLLEFEQQKNKDSLPVPQQEQARQGSRGNHDSLVAQARVQKPEASVIVKKVRAMYDLSSMEQDELSFRKGDVIIVLEQVYRDWWRGTLRGKVGIFPLNYVVPIEEQSPKEMEMEMEKENHLFAQKSNVDQLHYTLNSFRDENTTGYNDPTQNPAINNLYGSVTALRPEVAKTIGKYARKRDDLVSLRQVLSNAELTYNQLLDRATSAYTSSIPGRQSQSYQVRGPEQQYDYFTQQSNDKIDYSPQQQQHVQKLQTRQEQDERLLHQPQFSHPSNYGSSYGQSHPQTQNTSNTSHAPY